MAKTKGQWTADIARELRGKLGQDKRFQGVKVYYDHGKSDEEGVCKPTAYMGRRYGADATLGGIDIVVVHGKRVVLAAEIEEGYVRPKVILGDVFGVALAGGVMIEGERYSTDGAVVVVGLVVEDKGSRAKKYERLQRLLQNFLPDKDSGKMETRIAGVRIVATDQKELVKRLDRYIRRLVGTRTKGSAG